MFSSWSRFALFSASSRAESYSSCAASSWVLPASSWVRPLEIWNSPSCSWASLPLKSSCTATSAMAGSTAGSPRLASADSILARWSLSWVSISWALVSWSFSACTVSFKVCCSGFMPSFSPASACWRACSNTVALFSAVLVVDRVVRQPFSSVRRARRGALSSRIFW